MTNYLRTILPRVLSAITARHVTVHAACDAPLQDLKRQNDAISAALLNARTELAEVRAELDRHKATSLLREVNEQLVLSLIAANVHADEITQASTELRHLARTDQLTGLANRTCLFDRLAQAICHARRHGEVAALVYLDLNNFKQINDTFGHAVGDRVLVATASCIAATVRACDTVCRYGGDEFLVLLSEVHQATEITLVVEKIEAALALPKSIGDQVFELSASCGVSIFPEDGTDAETLINCADAAMYRTKRLQSDATGALACTSASG